MVFRQLFFAQFLEPFRVLGGGQDVDEVACFEDGFRIRDHVLSFSLDIDDDGLFQVWYAGERLVFQNGRIAAEVYKNAPKVNRPSIIRWAPYTGEDSADEGGRRGLMSGLMHFFR